ncbi:cellulase [Robertkochia marina]|uniref:Cellulase n=1 Tax=Robertkochia marina TaxID=1227945 RepID=A0A4S3M0V0_9FLAO|nr:glycoside hydrolase family 9 protein [Robertkochia marina]THD68062.1 cellulase [Robertkochia marina]TRZ42653.1 cellulase [Robertkochia marina]
MSLKNITLIGFLYAFFFSAYGQQNVYFRFNQLGYRPLDQKEIFIVSEAELDECNVFIYERLNNRKVLEIQAVKMKKGYYELEHIYSLDISPIQNPGVYYLKYGETQSGSIRIEDNVYVGAADYLLQYLRSRRCGYNPYFGKSCHTDDGIIIYHPERSGEKIDVTGGWHDASDYLQYVTTSANATYQLLFAYEQNPHAFADAYDARGDAGSNGIPDIIDEAKWGLDWLVKMNPEPGVMFHQIADDRDHRSFDFPYADTLDYGYGKGKERPVYFVTGEPQGLMHYKNRSDGKANIAGKFASCFALGSEVLKPFYPEFAASLLPKAVAAFKEGEAFPGVCQTAPCRAPYFYEEDNWVDDMELAAIQLYQRTANEEYLEKSLRYAAEEPVTPWMAKDSVSHYQYYPFVNLGHYYLSKETGGKSAGAYYKEGLLEHLERGRENIFNNGIPFVWCSNNLAAAMLTQMKLYSNNQSPLPGLNTTEASLRDWLFGKNPWGTSMVVGLPENGDYPEDTHAAISHYSDAEPWGGLVDGPVYGTIFSSLKGVKLSENDEYAGFQTSRVVYHDDWADYSTNEPTMDGTASLTYYLSSLVSASLPEIKGEITRGAITRGDTSKKKIALIFTGHDRAEGYEKVNTVLATNKVKASFFLTGDFYRNPDFREMIGSLREQGHYLGGHSNKHLLYCSWEDRDSLLVDRENFEKDLRENYKIMATHGIKKEDAYYYLPPYEWYNDKISQWTSDLGLKLINHTPGTHSNQDWTVPEMGEGYFSNDKIWDQIMTYEKEKGLHGFQLLLHFGTDPARKEKFYNRLEELINDLKDKGYEFVRIDELHV